jgi:hypothetical protein
MNLPRALPGAHDRAADLRYPAAILVLQEKDPPFALPVLTLITLRPVGLLACLNDFCAMTVGTLHWDRDHRYPPHSIKGRSHRTGKLLIWNMTLLLAKSGIFLPEFHVPDFSRFLQNIERRFQKLRYFFIHRRFFPSLFLGWRKSSPY